MKKHINMMSQNISIEVTFQMKRRSMIMDLKCDTHTQVTFNIIPTTLVVVLLEK